MFVVFCHYQQQLVCLCCIILYVFFAVVVEITKRHPLQVCETCFHENDEADKFTSRSLTEEFVNTRSKVRSERNDIYCEVTIERKMTSVVPVFWREQ